MNAITALLQILANLFGIAKTISDGQNTPEAKATAAAQQEVTEESREENEVAAVIRAKTPTAKQRALGAISADAAE